MTNDAWADRTDEQLMQELQGGEVAAFDTLFHRYKQPLLTFLARYTGDASVAEDLFQQVFLKIYQRADSFSGGASVKTWIYSIAVNAARDQFRRDKVRYAISLDGTGSGGGTGNDDGAGGRTGIDPEASQAAPEEEAVGQEVAAELEQALEQLEEDYRAPFVLARVNGLSYQEVADTLGMTVPTVRMRVHRAHHRLAASLSRHMTPARTARTEGGSE